MRVRGKCLQDWEGDGSLHLTTPSIEFVRRALRRSWWPRAMSDTYADVTSTPIRIPNESTRMCRLRPRIFLPASYPTSSAGPALGTD